MKFLILLIILNILSLFLYFKFLKNISSEQQTRFVKNLFDLKINNLSRGIIALKSQSIIIFCSILKDKFYDN